MINLPKFSCLIFKISLPSYFFISNKTHDMSCITNLSLCLFRSTIPCRRLNCKNPVHKNIAAFLYSGRETNAAWNRCLPSSDLIALRSQYILSAQNIKIIWYRPCDWRRSVAIGWRLGLCPQMQFLWRVEINLEDTCIHLQLSLTNFRPTGGRIVLPATSVSSYVCYCSAIH